MALKRKTLFALLIIIIIIVAIAYYTYMSNMYNEDNMFWRFKISEKYESENNKQNEEMIVDF